jgi:acetyl esterase
MRVGSDALAVDSEVAAVVARLPVIDIRGMSVEEVLTLKRGRRREAAEIVKAARRVETRQIDADGRMIPLKIYWPFGEGLHPVVMNIHGGGWVIGHPDIDDVLCHAITVGADCLTVSVDYRLAPEHPFPAGLEDCFAVLKWLGSKSCDLPIDKKRIAICGTSSGGNLAASTSLLARDNGGPSIAHQVLIYPVCDGGLDTQSYRKYNNLQPLTADSMRWNWERYIADSTRWLQPLASPLRAPDLRGLPPTFILTAEFDPLRDEGEEFGRRLSDAGVPVVVRRYDGVMHGFVSLAPNAKISRKAVDEIVAVIKQALPVEVARAD